MKSSLSLPNHGWLVALSMVTGLSCGSKSKVQHDPLMAVESVNLERYMGVWHEMARFPNRFQKDCVTSTAEYALTATGHVDVVNRCVRANGKLKEIRGTAWIPDPRESGKLKVRFFWPFSGDYWIIDLDPDNQYSVVGEPKRQYLWILARETQLSSSVLDQIIDRLKAKGYDPSRLQWSHRPRPNG